MTIQSTRRILAPSRTGIGDWGANPLLRPIPDVAAGRAGAGPVIARAAGFGAAPAGHPFGDIPRARVFASVVLRAAFHRFYLVTSDARGRPTRGAIVLRGVGRVDIAEYPGLHAVVLRHEMGLPQALCRKRRTQTRNSSATLHA